VWASEGLSGQAALTRAHRLVRAEPAAAAALAVRQWSILLMAVLFVPTLMTILGGNLGDYVRLLTGPFNSFAWFAILYPTVLSLLLFRWFGPAFFFLYLSARRCLGEAAGFSLPSVSRVRRSRRAASVRPATIAWLSPPVLISLFLLYKGIPHGGSTRDLLAAASAGRTIAALRELDSGLPVDSSDRHDWTPLMHAIAGGNLEFARELVARHANVNAQNSDGDTPLLIALWNRHSAEAEMLLAAGANVRMANEGGRTALFAAAMHGDSAMCRLLLARGADRAHRDQHGKTPLDYAKEEGHAEVVALVSAPVLY